MQSTLAVIANPPQEQAGWHYTTTDFDSKYVRIDTDLLSSHEIAGIQ